MRLERLGATGELKASVEVKNIGDRAGDEIVQLYVHDAVGSVARPVKELKAFRRITLAPGESRRVEFTVTRDQLAFWNADMKFGIEPGAYTLYIGPNSTEGLEASFEIPRAATQSAGPAGRAHSTSAAR